jgi:hypothetical protein
MHHQRPVSTYLLIMALLVTIGLPARSAFAEKLPFWYTQYFGDYLWSTMLFFGFALILQKTSTRKVAGITILFTYIIETTQLFHPQWLEDIRSIKIFGLILGYGFLWSDIIAYTLGISTGAWIEKFLLQHKK